MLTVCPCWTLCAEDGERLTEIGGEVAQPAMSIIGSTRRAMGTKGRNRVPIKHQHRFLSTTGSESRCELKPRKEERKNALDIKAPGK